MCRIKKQCIKNILPVFLSNQRYVQPDQSIEIYFIFTLMAIQFHLLHLHFETYLHAISLWSLCCEIKILFFVWFFFCFVCCVHSASSLNMFWLDERHDWMGHRTVAKHICFVGNYVFITCVVYDLYLFKCYGFLRPIRMQILSIFGGNKTIVCLSICWILFIWLVCSGHNTKHSFNELASHQNISWINKAFVLIWFEFVFVYWEALSNRICVSGDKNEPVCAVHWLQCLAYMVGPINPVVIFFERIQTQSRINRNKNNVKNYTQLS